MGTVVNQTFISGNLVRSLETIVPSKDFVTELPTLGSFL